MIEQYDPNEARNMETYNRVRLTFQQWNYKAVFEVDMGGDVPGLSNLSGIIDNVLCTEELVPVDEDGVSCITLRDPDGNTLEIDDHSNEKPLDEDTLMDMLVSAELIAVVPKYEGRARYVRVDGQEEAA